MFDSGKKGSIEKEKVRTILTTLGQTYDDKQLDSLLDGEDPEGKRQLTFSHKYLSYDT
jgi:calmodulin